MIGDSLKADIAGGTGAGIDTCWCNFRGAVLPEGAPQPTYTIQGYEELLRIVMEEEELANAGSKENAISFKSSNGTDIVAGIITPVRDGTALYPANFLTACANTSAVMTILPGIWRRKAMWFAATTIWDTAPQAAARTEQTAILPKRTDANLCCRICTK